MKKLLVKLIPAIFFVNISTGINAQAKLIMNGGIINITNSAILIIDNPDNTAITYNGSGYIQSEGMNNGIIWNIGTGNGNSYLIPFGNASDYLPVKFNAASGAGTKGSFSFSTYPTPTWKNSDFLPDGITNVNHNGTDNSVNVIDRFWQIKPQDYTTNPNLTNLVFTYSDNEFNAPNTITEGNLIVQRWNADLLSWSDYIPISILNTTNNTLTVPSISSNNLYDWWTLVDKTVALPVTLFSFEAIETNGKVHTKWKTTFEQNTSHFEVWRGTNAQQLNLIGTVSASGNSNTTRNYFLNDINPFSGISFYKLKTIDKDGSFTWSGIVSVSIAHKRRIFLYPTPAINYITISTGLDMIDKKPIAHLYDAGGKLLQVFVITNQNKLLNISKLPPGAYHINIKSDNENQTLPFIKK